MSHNDVYHNSFENKYRNPFGAAPRESEVTLAISIDKSYEVQDLILHTILDRTDEKISYTLSLMEKEEVTDRYGVTIKMPDTPQLVWYFFEIKLPHMSVYYGRRWVEESGEGDVYEHVPPSWQITVYDSNYQTPDWWKHAIMYQIFPDRFHSSGSIDVNNAPKSSLLHTHWDNDPLYIRNEHGDVIRWDFFGGNLQGIKDKLDYIQSLGVSVIYLNPIFEAESNHRYDTGDYHKIDPLLGTNDDLKKLVDEAKNRGIELMLDGVFSHTGSNSIYFNASGSYPSVGAYQAKSSPYYSWYTFYSHPDNYESWWGIGTLPTVNKEDASYQNFLIHDENSVLQSWHKLGINHWRLDVADELTDDFIKEIYHRLKKNNPSSVLLGEVWEDATNKIAYDKRREYFLGGELDSVMNYPLRRIMLQFINGDIDAHAVSTCLYTLQEHYPKQYYYSLMNLLSTHDVERIHTMLDMFVPDHMNNKERELIIHKQLKALSLWLYSFPGIPSLYYGDEAGLTGGADPDNRKPYPWGREDLELLGWYKKIGMWRNEHAALRTGDIKIHSLHEDVLCYERWITSNLDTFQKQAENGHFIFVMNRHVEEQYSVTLPFYEGRWVNLHDSNHILTSTQKGLSITLDGCESFLFKKI